jgi:hypothetical protein
MYFTGAPFKTRVSSQLAGTARRNGSSFVLVRSGIIRHQLERALENYEQRRLIGSSPRCDHSSTELSWKVTR